ncbi:MAG: PilZ domain-containing protein [Planctomycetota bacterium]
MLRTATGPVKPDIQRAVEELLRENSNFDRSENRSAIRDSLVRPVIIEYRDSEETVAAFSRNISATGIGLITNEPVTNKKVAVIRVNRLHGTDVSILAECRWCKAYGEEWYFSGWQFISLKR